MLAGNEALEKNMESSCLGRGKENVNYCSRLSAPGEGENNGNFSSGLGFGEERNYQILGVYIGTTNINSFLHSLLLTK